MPFPISFENGVLNAQIMKPVVWRYLLINQRVTDIFASAGNHQDVQFKAQYFRRFMKVKRIYLDLIQKFGCCGMVGTLYV